MQFFASQDGGIVTISLVITIATVL